MTIYESEEQKKEKEDIKKAEDTLKKALKSKEYKEASELLKQVYAIINVEKYLDKLICGVKVATLIGLIDGFLLAANAFVKSEQLKAIGQAAGLAHEVSELVSAIQKSANLSKNIGNVVDGGIGVASSVMGILDDYVIQSREFHTVRTASDMAKNISEIKYSMQNISNILRSGPMIPYGTLLKCSGIQTPAPIKVTHILPLPIQIMGKNAANIADNQADVNILAPYFVFCDITQSACTFQPDGLWQGCSLVYLCGKPTINTESELFCVNKGVIRPILAQDTVSAGMIAKEAVGIFKNSNELLKTQPNWQAQSKAKTKRRRTKTRPRTNSRAASSMLPPSRILGRSSQPPLIRSVSALWHFPLLINRIWYHTRSAGPAPKGDASQTQLGMV